MTKNDRSHVSSNHNKDGSLVLWASNLKERNQKLYVIIERVRSLEEEYGIIKQDFLESMEERTKLMNEIYEQFENILVSHGYQVKSLRALYHGRRWYLPPLKPMEVEVKLRLPDSASHQRLSDLLSPFHSKTYLQENLFFDGPNAELSSNLAVLRLRFYDLDARCVVSLKANPVISDGISRVEEDEEPIEPAVARACVTEPWRLLAIDSSRIVKRVTDEFRVGEKGLVCLGGFRNVRAVYDWKGLKLELDESNYDFGTSYEIECESSDPDRAKKMLEELLDQNEISYSYSEVSKFAIFMSRKLP